MAKGLQQIECAVARSKVESLCDILPGAVAQLELSVSLGPPLPKRHKQVATAMVSRLTTEESEALVPKPKGGASVQGALLCPFLIQRGKQYQLRWIPCKSMWAILNRFTAVLSKDYKGIFNLLSSHMVPCVLDPSRHKVILYLIFPYFFNTDALQCHGKWAHSSGSSDPI